MTLFLDLSKSDSFFILVKNVAAVDALWICNISHWSILFARKGVVFNAITYLREVSARCSFNQDGQCQSLDKWDG